MRKTVVVVFDKNGDYFQTWAEIPLSNFRPLRSRETIIDHCRNVANLINGTYVIIEPE